MSVSTKVIKDNEMHDMVLGYTTTEMASFIKDNMRTIRSKASASTLQGTRKSTKAGLSMARGTV